MRRKILITVLLVVLGSMISMGFLLTGMSERYLLGRLEDKLLSNAELMARVVAQAMEEGSHPHAWEDLAASLGKSAGARVTIIDLQGNVLGDSAAKAAELDSHLGRPEIQQALQGRVGTSIRYSSSLHTEMLYLAVPVVMEDRVVGGVRVALSLEEVYRVSRFLWKWILATGLVVFLVAGLISFMAASSLTKPLQEIALTAGQIAQGRYSERLRSRRWTGEIKVLAEAFNRMAGNLEDFIHQLTGRKRLLETILGSMDDSLIAVDAEGRVMVLNPPAAELFGVSEAQAAGRHLLEVVRHEGLFHLVDAVLQQGQTVRQELTLYTPHEKHFKVHVTPLAAENSRGAVAVLRDMTDVRRAEQMRREFVANVSHELRTPLTSIAGYVETLLGGAYQDPAVNLRFLGIIQREAERLKKLIEDLLQLSRIESAKGQSAPVPVDVAAVASRAANLLATALKERDQQLIYDFPEHLSPALAVEDSLEQVFLNLIDNAGKYSPPGTSITIRAEEDETHVACSVIDQGTGIPPEALPRIFERFYRVDKARTREVPGTGLGLALVKHLVDGMGGTVEVRSELGKGSRFTVRLPKAAVRQEGSHDR